MENRCSSSMMSRGMPPLLLLLLPLSIMLLMGSDSTSKGKQQQHDQQGQQQHQGNVSQKEEEFSMALHLLMDPHWEDMLRSLGDDDMMRTVQEDWLGDPKRFQMVFLYGTSRALCSVSHTLPSYYQSYLASKLLFKLKEKACY
jgi:hypothetical protein